MATAKRKTAKKRAAPKASARPCPVASITISGFKSVAEAQLDLGWFNVLVGANGSGKTGLLEAIGVLGAAADGRVGDDDLQERGVRPGVPQLFKTGLASLDPLPRAIRLSAESGEGAGYQVTLDNPQASAAMPWRFIAESFRDGKRMVVSRSPRGGNFRPERGPQEKLANLDPIKGLARSRLPVLPSHIERLRGVLQGYAIFDPQTAVLRGIQPDMRRQREPVGLQGGRLAEAVAFLLEDGERYGARFLDEVRGLISWISDIGVEPPSADILSPSVPALREVVRFTDKYLRTDRNRLSAYDASEGALYVLFALVLMVHPRAPEFFAVENIDHALHPRLARALVRRLASAGKANRRQVLLTTHNPLVLDALDLSDPDVRLFTVDRADKGDTQVRRLEWSEAIAKAQNSGLTLSQLWVQGALGGVPDLW